MRCRVESPDIPPSQFTIQAEAVSQAEAPYELVKTMRASVLSSARLLLRFGYARVSMPGGCAIGARPVDLHIQGLEKLGAEISVDHGYVEARAKRLRGATFRFPKITVTGTENILTAAVLAEGETILENCALEPEVTDLVDLLDQDGRENRRRRHFDFAYSRRRAPWWRHSPRDSRPNRSRHISRGRCDYRGRTTARELRPKPPGRDHRKAQRLRRRNPLSKAATPYA